MRQATSGESIPAVFIKSIAIVLVSVVIAGAVTCLRPGGAALTAFIDASSDGRPAGKVEVMPVVEGVEDIDLPTAKKLFDSKKVVFLDSRSAAEYMAGHVAGAKNLPYDKFEKHFIDVLGRCPPEQEIVTYCSGEGCNSSVILAQKLLDEGFAKVMVFYGGWPEWEKAGYPIEKGTDNPLGGVGF